MQNVGHNKNTANEVQERVAGSTEVVRRRRRSFLYLEIYKYLNYF